MDFLATPRRRRVFFAALYFSEGAPIGFVWWCLPALLRTSGVPVARITSLTALLVLPWTLKFLWAPIVDIARSARWSLRHWIAAAQVLMGLTLAPLAFFDLAGDFRWIVPLLFFHACAAATQDVAIDALAITSVSPAERGRINGWMQAGMLLGRALLGGGALLLVSTWGFKTVVLIMLLVLSGTLVLVLGARETAAAPADSTNAGRARSVVQALVGAAAQRRTWLALLFAGTAGAAFEGVGSVAQPFLIDRGLTPDEVGLIYLVPVVACMIAGALLGGLLSDRIDRPRCVAGAQLLLVGAVALLAVVAGLRQPEPGSHSPELTILMAVYFGAGLLTASMYALLMDLTDPRIGATQFSAYMGATNGCEAWAGYASGRLVDAEHAPVLNILPASFAGYPLAFLAMAAATLLSMPLLPALRVKATGHPVSRTLGGVPPGDPGDHP